MTAKRKPAAPFYAVAALWLLGGLFLPLYSNTAIALLAAVSAAVFLLVNGICQGGRAAAGAFMDRLKMISIATHVADARTCVLHPASHTHRQLSDEQLIEAGVDPAMIRLSVGIEDKADIIEDIRQALEA